MKRVLYVGVACSVGGIALFCDLALHLFSGLGSWYFVFAAFMALCLAGGPLGLMARGAVVPGWRSALGWAGSATVLGGLGLWLVAFTLLFFNPAAAFSQRLTPGGSLLMAIGMLLLGVAVLASRQLRGWHAVVPLLVGLYFPAQLTLQLAFFLNGRDGTPGPNGALLGLWGLLWVLLGYVICAAPRRPHSLDRRRSVSQWTA